MLSNRVFSNVTAFCSNAWSPQHIPSILLVSLYIPFRFKVKGAEQRLNDNTNTYLGLSNETSILCMMLFLLYTKMRRSAGSPRQKVTQLLLYCKLGVFLLTWMYISKILGFWYIVICLCAWLGGAP